MKKCLMVFLSLCAVGNAFGYKFTIDNQTPHSLKVGIGRATCKSRVVTVKPHSKQTKSWGDVCCFTKVKVQNAINAKSKAYFNPSGIKGGFSCSNITMVVRLKADGTFDLKER